MAYVIKQRVNKWESVTVDYKWGGASVVNLIFDTRCFTVNV